MKKQTYAKFMNLINKYKKYGEKHTSLETRLVCHVPHVGSEAWFHSLYRPLKENEIRSMDRRLKLPEIMVDFYTLHNGLKIFSDTIRIYGIRSSFVRTGDEVYQPYDIYTSTSRLYEDFPDHYFIFGSYNWDRSRLVIDKNNNKIYRTEEEEPVILNEWADFDTWLLSETERLMTLFDEKGVPYDDDQETTP